MNTQCWIQSWMLALGAMLFVCGTPCFAAPPQIPDLQWQKRSDWISVKTDIAPAAVGDGIADDTKAIQAALDKVTNGSVIYFPAGTYRITDTLRPSAKKRAIGVLFIGHGRATRLVWDGDAGKSMWVDGIASHSRYIGFSFDGKGKAAVGLHHLSTDGGFFKTEVGHRHMAFFNFTDAGILADKAPATAETMTENCLFENCKRGIAFVAFNDYDFTIDGCTFRRCEIGVETRHGNCYVRNCRFEGSTTSDLALYPEHGSSVRRCTSVGSKKFLTFSNSVAPLTIENCIVSAWTDPESVVALSGAPVVMFDCAFVNPPGKNPPVRVNAKQPLFLSNNTPLETKALVQAAEKSRLYVIPPGKRKGAINSPALSFLNDTAETPTTIFDAKRDFGAMGDGKTDDTLALQKTIDAAREKSGGAIAYLPTGRYIITQTLKISGENYTVGGTGFCAAIQWKGAEGGTMIEVTDPQRITLENLSVGNHDAGPMNNQIDILQTGTDKPSFVTYDNVSVFGMYQCKPMTKGLWLRGLSEKSVVAMPHVQGNIHLVNAGRATILAGNTYEGSIVVEGKDKRRGGFFGILARLATVCTHAAYVKDNHSLVASDFYVEQAQNGFLFEGSPDDPPGRVTIQSPKMHMTIKPPAANVPIEINNYSGQIFLGPVQYYIEPAVEKLMHTGDRPIEFFVWASCFYKPKLEITKSPAAKIVTVGNTFVDSVSEMADQSAPEVLKRLSVALDDLRELGETDLRVNYASKRKAK